MTKGRWHRLDRRWRITLIVGLLYVLTLGGVAIHRHREPLIKGTATSDYAKFHLTARHFLETGRMTPDLGVYNYLPFFTIMMVPFAALPTQVGAVLLLCISVTCVLLTVWIVLRGLIQPSDHWLWAKAVAPLLMAIPFIHACLVIGQVPILMGFLCVLGWWLAIRHRYWAAGLPLSMAFLVKPFLLTLLIFFVLKRQWRLVAASLVWSVILGAGLTYAVMERSAWVDAHRDYYRQVARGRNSLALLGTPGPSRFERIANQSLTMVMRRLMTKSGEIGLGKPLRMPVGPFAPRTLQICFVVLIASISLMTLFVGRHPLRSISPERANLEFALFLLWGLFPSPIVWTFYFPMALPALVLLTAVLIDARGSEVRYPLGTFAWYFWVAGALAFITEIFVAAYLRAFGIHLWATLLLWAAMVELAVRQGTTAGTSSASAHSVCPASGARDAFAPNA